MALYFFDTRDDDKVMIDDEGLEFASFDAVKRQATRSLAELALEVLPGVDKRCLGVDVRDAQSRAVLTAQLTFEARVLLAD